MFSWCTVVSSQLSGSSTPCVAFHLLHLNRNIYISFHDAWNILIFPKLFMFDRSYLIHYIIYTQCSLQGISFTSYALFMPNILHLTTFRRGPLYNLNMYILHANHQLVIRYEEIYIPFACVSV